MERVGPLAPEAVRLRRRIRGQRLAGFAMLAALLYAGWAGRVLLDLLGLVGIVTIPSANTLPAIGFGVLGALGCAAWWALLRPAILPSGTGPPSFERMTVYLLHIIRAVTGLAPRGALANDDAGNTGTRSPRQTAMAALTLITAIAACSVVRDWLLIALLAALMPMLGIAAVRLLARSRVTPPDGRAERTVLVLMSALAAILVVVLARERVRSDVERGRVDGLSAAIRASGIQGDTRADLQQVLRLSLVAHQTIPSRLSANGLRQAIDALPIPLGMLWAKRRGTFGGEDVERLENIGASPTGAYVSGGTRDTVYVWSTGSERPIGQFGCIGLRDPFHFSADESLLAATCQWGASLLFWDVGARRMRSQVALKDVTRVQISPDSGVAAVIAGKTCVHLILVANGANVATQCADTPVVDATFDRGGHRLAIARGPGAVTLEFIDFAALPAKRMTEPPPLWAPAAAWFAIVSAPTAVMVHSWQPERPPVRVVHPGITEAFVSPAGNRLITIGHVPESGSGLDQDTIKAWTLPDGREEATLSLRGAGTRWVAGGANAEAVAWMSRWGDSLYYWKVGDPGPRARMEQTGLFALTTDGRVLVVGSTRPATSETPSARLWAPGNDDQSTTMRWPGFRVADVRLDADSGRAFLLYADHVLVVDPVSGSVAATIPHGSVVMTAIAPNGRYAATRRDKHELTLWLIAGGLAEKIDRDVPPEEPVCSILFAPDSSWVAIRTCTGTLRIVGTATAVPRMSARIGSGDGATQLVASTDSHLLATNDEHTVVVFDVSRAQQILTIPVPQNQGRGHARVAFRPHSHDLVVAYTDQPTGFMDTWASIFRNNRVAEIWDVDRRVRVARFQPQRVSDVNLLAFSRDGTQVALTNSWNGPVEIWRVNKPALRVTIEARVRSVIFGDDGRYVFAVDAYGTPRVWATDSGSEIDALPVTDVSAGLLSGRYAVTVSASRELRRWLIQPDQLIAAGCARVDLDGTVRSTSVPPVRPACPERPDSRTTTSKDR